MIINILMPELEYKQQLINNLESNFRHSERMRFTITWVHERSSMELCCPQSSSQYPSELVSESSMQLMSRFPIWLIFFHSELRGDKEDSCSFLLQYNSRYLGCTARRYSGSVSMVASSSRRLSSAGTPSRTSSFVQRTILIFCNLLSSAVIFFS